MLATFATVAVLIGVGCWDAKDAWRLGAGEAADDLTVATPLLTREHHPEGPYGLSQREQEVLALMAEGQSNARVATTLSLSGKTVERHVSHIFAKLGLVESPDEHRRVLAVLAWLREG